MATEKYQRKIIIWRLEYFFFLMTTPHPRSEKLKLWISQVQVECSG